MSLILIALPIIFGVLIFLVKNLEYYLSLLACVFTFIASIVLAFGSFNFQNTIPWLKEYHINILLYADKLSSFSVLLVSFFSFIVVLYSKKILNYVNTKYYFSFVLFLLGVSNLVLLSKNWVVFLFAWELLAILVYLLIRFTTKNDEYAVATKAFYILGFSDFSLFLGIIMLILSTKNFEISTLGLSTKEYSLIFAFLTIGALGKVGSVPFHNWIPDTAEKLPGSILGYLIGSLDKIIGIYLLVRIVKDIFVFTQHSFLMFLGAITILIAVFMALIQHNLKKLLSYHAISQIGYMILGISTGNVLGIIGGVFHMINNTIYKTLLFLTSDIVEQTTGDVELSKPKSLAKYLPITFISAVIASLSISGVPPFNGFYSKWLIYQGVFESVIKTKSFVSIFCVISAVFGSALTLASFIKVLYSIFSSNTKQEPPNIEERKFIINLIPLITLAVLCLIFGIWAKELPIKYFVSSMLNLKMIKSIGEWTSTVAAVFILIGLVLGVVIYFISNIRVRKVPIYILGEEEKLKDSMISGTDFYNSVVETYPFSVIYTFAEQKLLDFYNWWQGIIYLISKAIKLTLSFEIFDVYKFGKRIVFSVGQILSSLHNGNLHFYLSWVFLGIIILSLIYLF